MFGDRGEQFSPAEQEEFFRRQAQEWYYRTGGAPVQNLPPGMPSPGWQPLPSFSLGMAVGINDCQSVGYFNYPQWNLVATTGGKSEAIDGSLVDPGSSGVGFAVEKTGFYQVSYNLMIDVEAIFYGDPSLPDHDDYVVLMYIVANTQVGTTGGNAKLWNWFRQSAHGVPPGGEGGSDSFDYIGGTISGIIFMNAGDILETPFRVYIWGDNTGPFSECPTDFSESPDIEGYLSWHWLGNPSTVGDTSILTGQDFTSSEFG